MAAHGLVTGYRNHARAKRAAPNDTLKPQWQDPAGGPREEPGLPSAWVAAIAVNVALVALFLIFVLYCYIRSRKRANKGAAPEMRGSFETQLDKATTQPLALEAPRRSPLTWPALESQHDVPVIRTQSVHSADKESGIIEGVEDDEEPELKGLSPDESDEELPSEPLPRAPEDGDTSSLPATHQADSYAAFLPGVPTNSSPPKGQYQVCLVAGGGRDCVGSIELPLDRPVTLAELRTALGAAADAALRELTSASRFGFVTEALRPLSPGEAETCVVQQIYPSRAVMLRDTRGESIGTTYAVETSPVSWEEEREPGSTTPPVISHDPELNQASSLAREVIPARPWRKTTNGVHTYVGPLGVCQRPDCGQPGRVKCIDCGLASYCSSRCLKADAARHRLSCYRECSN
ncbi:uncharacterized protein LOC119455843 [Dermacentor silvarum]|uniref:uncharacterized protein LOC119455843 n=1 Tax=Dermacentor silvarum TaxID=543639 RepID=UPI002100AEE5|nr:uncharacterized protein LOC119455843 [Dermacentor silvarum]